MPVAMVCKAAYTVVEVLIGNVRAITGEESVQVDREIDVVGRSCPLPLITLAKEVRAMQRGQVVRIIGNDPIFEETVVDFCREGGHELLETTRSGKVVSMVIRV